MITRLEVYDLECLSNLFTYTGFDCKKKEYYQYCICSWRNDIVELYKHLNDKNFMMIGFNNEAYDYPLLHNLLNHYQEYINMSGLEIVRLLYSKSQEIINMDFSEIADKHKFIPQLDLYKIWHFNNNARKTSC